MRRRELAARTRQLVDEGDRLEREPSLGALQLWLQLSDDLLATAWGSMDRYHLAWLSVGKSASVVRGRAMTPEEEAAYVREVVRQKDAVLRMSLEAVERGMPFVGEDEGVVGEGIVGEGEGEGAVGDAGAAGSGGAPDTTPTRPAPPPRRGPSDPGLARRLEEARLEAARHREHERRAPRPPKMQR